MYKCGNCNEVFAEPVTVKDGETGNYIACPHCHDTGDIYEVRQCPECGKLDDVDDMPLFTGMCIDCFKNKYTDKLGFTYFNSLIPIDQNAILENIFNCRMQSYSSAFNVIKSAFIKSYTDCVEDNALFVSKCKWRFSEDLKSVVFDDLSDFSDWCEREQVFDNG